MQGFQKSSCGERATENSRDVARVANVARTGNAARGPCQLPSCAPPWHPGLPSQTGLLWNFWRGWVEQAARGYQLVPMGFSLDLL